jgi:hypothetical protein
VADIGADPELADDIAVQLATPELVQALLPARPVDGHKGAFGSALVVAGSVNYTGAAHLAGAAAYRAGAGLVTLGVIPQHSSHPGRGLAGDHLADPGRRTGRDRPRGCQDAG